MRILPVVLVLLMTFVVTNMAVAGGLTWPLACIPGIDCNGNKFYLGYPDIDGDGKAFNCGPAGYKGHTGTDIVVGSIDDGVAVVAADDGEVVLVSGGREDTCTGTSDKKPDVRPVADPDEPKVDDPGPVCIGPDGCFAWGFDAGNFVLIRHPGDSTTLYTLYAHLHKSSITVSVGQQVKRGEKLAEVGCTGASLIPHLHFSVFRKRPLGNELVDPWRGPCSVEPRLQLWQYDPPYRSDLTITKGGKGDGLITCENNGTACGTGSIKLIPGTIVTLKAVPYYGSDFAGWEGSCSGSAHSCTLKVAGSTSVTGVFVKTEHR